jgi:ABC-type transport system substrate-binding protein
MAGSNDGKSAEMEKAISGTGAAARLPIVSLPLVGREAAAGWGWAPNAAACGYPHPTPAGPPSPQGGGRRKGLLWTRRALLGSGLALGAGLLLTGRSFAATDQLIVGLAEEPPQLDPAAGNAASTEAVAYQNIFEGLTRIDRDGKVQPGLARSWTVSPDGRGYSFALQPEVRYHDGTSFDAQHVVFSLRRLIGPGSASPRKSLYEAITAIEAPDDATIRITLRQPDERLLFNLGLGDAAIVAPESADNNGQVPIGTGPFAFVQWDSGQRIVMERNEDYWGPHPRISQVTFVFIADPAAAVAALLAGSIDGFPHFPAAAALEPLKGNPAVEITTGTGPDGEPRLGVWNSKLGGMWTNAPVESCVLSEVRWAGDSGPMQPGPTPNQTQDD